MKYGSVCSGIEAASVAWHNLGWEPQWFSEIEQFPSEVLKHRFPDVPNLGDMTQLTQNPTFNERSIDLLVGGTPCQSFSVAGLRKGLADPRGNLMLTFLALADAKKPKWIVWENVPGVLSSNGGRDFGTFLGALGELGYGFAYRVLDAQYFGVAQRRRRVFVVGYLGDWRVAAAVLFESESLQGNPKPSRKKREEAATYAQGSVGESGDVSCVGGNLSPTVTSKWKTGYGGPSGSNETGNMVYAQPIGVDLYNQCITGDTFQTVSTRINASTTGGVMEFSAVAQPLYYESHPNDSRVNGPKDVADTVSARYGTGGGNTPLVQQPFRKVRRAQSDSDFETWEKDETANTINCFDVGDVRSTNVVAQPISIDAECNARTNQFGTLVRGGEGGTQQFVAQPMAFDWQSGGDMRGMSLQEKTQLQRCQTPAVMHSMAFPINTENMFEGSTSYGRTVGENNEPSFALTKAHSHAVATGMAIRRLTPKECERLQGFPDDWTKIPYRNKEADQCPDGPRYKACGNSMAVPVMRWIGQRIQYVENLMKEL
jgi:DNA (cytosine-5)-methyltransferase 1